MLIAAGADVDMKNGNGLTPLHLAAHRASTKTVQHLLAAGADPNGRGPQGSTALHWAPHAKLPAMPVGLSWPCLMPVLTRRCAMTRAARR